VTRLRLTSLHLLITATILVGALAVDAHEVAIHSAACFFGPWHVPPCQVLP